MTTAAASMLMAAGLTLAVPGISFAMNEVECAAGENYLKIWSHSSGGDEAVNCYANAGYQYFDGWWIDKISTGNNKFAYRDGNGRTVVKIDPWQTVTYPNNPPKVMTIMIY